MRLKGPLVVQCQKCNEVIEVSTDLELMDAEDRPMGTEVYYSSSIEDECPKCGNDIKIDLEVWEYPLGAVEHQREFYDGVEMIQRPEYDPFDY